LKSQRIATRFRRLSLNKIFISKAELKHTSSKVIITLFIYNEEKRLLSIRLSKLVRVIFPYLIKDDSKLNFSLKTKLYNIEGQKETIPLLNYLNTLRLSIIKLLSEQKNLLLYTKNSKLLKNKQLFINNLESFLININNTIIACEKDNVNSMYSEKLYGNLIRKIIMEKEIIAIAYYKLLLNINKSKFEDQFLAKLKPLLRNIYNKEIEFNIINLKTLYLNSDIFTQAIAIKLKNRDNRLLRVLNSFLRLVKLPNVNSIRERYGEIDINQLLVNKIKNIKLNSIFSNYNGSEDVLNKLLFNILPAPSLKEKKEVLPLVKSNSSQGNTNSTIQDIILNSLKYKSMAGARLEAKGRLTKRFTASRSVFKIK
jgi:Mitochondrial ribosomal protein (VAR1)